MYEQYEAAGASDENVYPEDSGDRLPPRTNQWPWPTLLQEYFLNLDLLVCPSDAQRGTPQTETSSSTPADRSPRSYLINGWNDYFRRKTGNQDVPSFNGLTLKVNVSVKPSDIILFGEKKNI